MVFAIKLEMQMKDAGSQQSTSPQRAYLLPARNYVTHFNHLAAQVNIGGDQPLPCWVWTMINFDMIPI